MWELLTALEDHRPWGGTDVSIDVWDNVLSPWKTMKLEPSPVLDRDLFQVDYALECEGEAICVWKMSGDKGLLNST